MPTDAPKGPKKPDGPDKSVLEQLVGSGPDPAKPASAPPSTPGQPAKAPPREVDRSVLDSLLGGDNKDAGKN